MSEVCPECPLLNSLAAAKELIEERRTDHPNADKALGGIALTEECLQRITKKIGCSEPAEDQNGQNVCPNKDATMGIRAFAAAPWPAFEMITTTFTARSDKPEPGNPGQYI